MKKTICMLLSILVLAGLLSTGSFAVSFVNIWSDNEHPSYLAAYAGDGDTEKFWHTDWENGITEPPYTITFELDGVYRVTSVGLLPRQDNTLNGLIYVFNLYVSEDGETYTLVKEVDDFYSDTEMQTVTFDAPVTARFIRIEALDTEGVSFASLNELEVQGELVEETPVADLAPTETAKTEIEHVSAETADSVETLAPQTADAKGVLLLCLLTAVLSMKGLTAIKKKTL